MGILITGSDEKALNVFCNFHIYPYQTYRDGH